MRNWKTTALGAVLIVLAVLSFAGITIPYVSGDPNSAGLFLIAGLIAIFAKDFDK